MVLLANVRRKQRAVQETLGFCEMCVRLEVLSIDVLGTRESGGPEEEYHWLVL